MEIKRYVALIWRWAWLIVLGTVAAGSAAYLISNNTTPVYRSSSRLLSDEATGSSAGNEYAQLLVAQRLVQTYVEILQTQPVLEETIKRLELPFDTARLARMISTSAPQDTQIIEINVEDTDPARAADIANTLGAVFIDQNQARENLRYAEPIANWQARLDETADEIEDLETKINNFGAEETAEEQAALSRLQTQLEGAKIRYTEAFDNLNSLQISQAKESSNVVQIEPAQKTNAPIRPRTLVNTLLAAIVGGMLALGIIFLIEYLDDTIKNPDQVQEDTALSTLGAIAYIKGPNPTDCLITHRTPRDPISEAFRMLRTNLSFSAVDGGLHSLLITSSSPGEGKSTTTANLAVVMAQTGQRVIVVDADLRRPVQHKIFEVPNNQGITTAILDNKTPVSYHMQKTRIPDLSILTSGPIPPNPAELLNSQRMAQVLETLGREADLILFDTPPTLTVADASILAPQVDGCLLVIESGRTKRTVFVQAVERLHKSGAALFGAVMNRSRPGRGGYYDYYYYYHYYNAYEYSRKKRRRKSRGRMGNWLPGVSRR